jgi:hypothetical protein
MTDSDYPILSPAHFTNLSATGRNRTIDRKRLHIFSADTGVEVFAALYLVA